MPRFDSTQARLVMSEDKEGDDEAAPQQQDAEHDGKCQEEAREGDDLVHVVLRVGWPL